MFPQPMMPTLLIAIWTSAFDFDQKRVANRTFTRKGKATEGQKREPAGRLGLSA
jgi:hypothetical protein